MDRKILKLIGMGTCAYFLMLDSVLSFLLQTWYLPSGAAGFVLTVIANFLMLAAGFVIWKRYPERFNKTVNSASLMIGGAAILIVTGQLLLRIMLMRLVSDSFKWSLASILFLSMIAAFAAIGAISLWKGLEGTKDDSHATELRVLCYRTALIFLFFRGVNYFMWWLQPFLTLQYYELNTRDLIYFIVPAVSIVAGTALYFAPLRINTSIRSMDAPKDRVLSGWAQVIGGWLILITGMFDLIERMILLVMQLFSVFGGYGEDTSLLSVLLPFAQPLILILIGIVLIIHGRKHANH